MKDYSDSIALGVAGVTGAIQLGAALAKGANGVQSLTLPTNTISPRDKQKLEQITLFRLINRYADRYVTAHGSPTGEGGTLAPGETPAPSPQAAPAGPERPHGGPETKEVDVEIVNAVRTQVEQEVNALWRDGVWPDGTEYVWGEGGGGGVNWKSDEAVGVTGAIAWSNLRARAMTDTPSLNANATSLGFDAPAPGTLTVRQIVGGNLDRSGSWSDSWFDKLYVNIATAEPAWQGPDDSVMIQVQTDWNWDDNTTVWDFLITVNPDGTPNIQEHRSGVPDDSRLFGTGEAGQHGTMTPTGAEPPPSGGSGEAAGGYGAPGTRVQRAPLEAGALARTPAFTQATQPTLSRFIQIPSGAAIAAALTGETAQIVTAAIGATMTIGQTINALAQGQSGVAKYNLPGNQMSEPDQRKMRQLVSILLVNAYCADYERRHPVGPQQEQPAPAPTDTTRTTNAPTAEALDQVSLELAKASVLSQIEGMWKNGIGDGKQYTWDEDDGRDPSPTVGIAGTVSFSNLRTRAIDARPTLNQSARNLGVNMPAPDRLVIRQFVSGTFDGTISASWYDDLAVNPTPAVISDSGPDQSIQINLGTNWLWDNNATVWDFVITIKEDGTPFVEDARNGVPAANVVGWGEGGQGGTHKSLRPTGGRGANVANPANQPTQVGPAQRGS